MGPPNLLRRLETSRWDSMCVLWNDLPWTNDKDMATGAMWGVNGGTQNSFNVIMSDSDVILLRGTAICGRLFMSIVCAVNALWGNSLIFFGEHCLWSSSVLVWHPKGFLIISQPPMKIARLLRTKFHWQKLSNSQWQSEGMATFLYTTMSHVYQLLYLPLFATIMNHQTWSTIKQIHH